MFQDMAMVCKEQMLLPQAVVLTQQEPSRRRAKTRVESSRRAEKSLVFAYNALKHLQCALSML